MMIHINTQESTYIEIYDCAEINCRLYKMIHNTMIFYWQFYFDVAGYFHLSFENLPNKLYY
jgi:hypothetical protein